MTSSFKLLMPISTLSLVDVIAVPLRLIYSFVTKSKLPCVLTFSNTKPLDKTYTPVAVNVPLVETITVRLVPSEDVLSIILEPSSLVMIVSV